MRKMGAIQKKNYHYYYRSLIICCSIFVIEMNVLAYRGLAFFRKCIILLEINVSFMVRNSVMFA